VANLTRARRSGDQVDEPAWALETFLREDPAIADAAPDLL
jgi:hypothetical protein